MMFSTPAFDATLARDVLNVTMREHHATEASARGAVEPMLQAWEKHDALVEGRPLYRFAFGGSSIINRAGSEGSANRTLAAVQEIRASMTAHVIRGNYPSPPEKTISVDPNFELLYGRWELFARRRDTLPSMAYFCLTAIRVMYGSGDVEKAAAALRISGNVLRTLRRLTRGAEDAMARKYTPDPPITPNEEAWVRAAVPRLILRVGEVAAEDVKHLPVLTMAEFPGLSRSNRRAQGG